MTTSASGPAAPRGQSVDLRGLDPGQARSRAFTESFRAKPGSRLTLLANRSDVEAEIMKWLEEIGHRHLRSTKIEDNGASHTVIEIIKVEARR